VSGAKQRWWVPGVRDVLVFGGLALVAAGAGWIFPPAGLIAAGAGLLVVAYWG